MQNWIANVQSKLERIFIAKGTRNKQKKNVKYIIYEYSTNDEQNILI